jgi:hypothetical protein
MDYSTHLYFLLATLPLARPAPTAEYAGQEDPALADVVAPDLHRLWDLVAAFRRQPVSPAATQQFERQLQEALRQLGRGTVQHTYNHLEPDDVAGLARHVRFEATLYTRLNAKTPQDAWTLFGPIRLRRVGYRPTDKDGDATLFPLTAALGLRHGASPALAERAARLLASAGMTQQQTLTRLRQDQGVTWGVKKLRQVTAAVAQALTAQRHDAQGSRCWPGWARRRQRRAGTSRC